MAAPRSPNYPQVSLVRALEDIKKVAAKDDRNKISPAAVAEHLGYTTLNGAAQVALSVLKKYGLLDGKGDKLGVSDTAYTIVHASADSPEYQAAVRKAALAPSLFSELRKEFPDTIPSPGALRHHLITKKFNAEAATKAAHAYRETMELVTKVGGGYNAPDAERDNGKLSVGDLVDWESQGVLQNEEPLCIKGFSNDGAYAFVEGSPTGLPVSELTRVEGSPVAKPAAGQPPAPLASLAPPPPAPLTPPGGAIIPPAQGGVKQDVFSLAEGQAVLRWPETLSRESYADFADWLGLVMRKVARAAGVQVEEKPGRPA
jgi:hypothetical protein